MAGRSLSWLGMRVSRQGGTRATEAAIHGFTGRLLGRWSPIIVSNRPPYEPEAGGGFRRGSGGLVTALLSLAEATQAPWVACARGARERELAAKPGATRVSPRLRPPLDVHYVDPGRKSYDAYYSVIANPLIWFIQHYLWELGRQPVIDQATHRAWDQGYVEVNRVLADRVVSLAAATDREPLVMTQDYHLYLLPEFVRDRLPAATLQHFIHIPWPTAEYWKVLPDTMRSSIFRGLLANDVIGFQTPRDVSRFLAGCAELLGLRVDHQDQAVLYRGRVVWARSYPISVDVDGLERTAGSAAVLQEEERIRSWGVEKLIVRVDRTDPSKNVLRGFAAYEHLLRAHPELVGRVQFWAFLQPSRQDVAVYRDYLKSIHDTVDSINSRLGRRGWLPIRLELGENFNRALAAYRHFDVLLVNPIYDGMNLVAKEGALLNRRDGVLVLSENAGAWYELGAHSIVVNPFDIEAGAKALYEALTLEPARRRRLLERLRQTVRSYDISAWIRAQLEDINEIAVPASNPSAAHSGPQPEHALPSAATPPSGPG